MNNILDQIIARIQKQDRENWTIYLCNIKSKLKQYRFWAEYLQFHHRLEELKEWQGTSNDQVDWQVIEKYAPIMFFPPSKQTVLRNRIY